MLTDSASCFTLLTYKILGSLKSVAVLLRAINIYMEAGGIVRWQSGKGPLPAGRGKRFLPL